MDDAQPPPEVVAYEDLPPLAAAQAGFEEPAPADPSPIVSAAAQPLPPPGAAARLLAGLESGVLGALIMIAWFALDALYERQYWWAMLNLWGAGIYHNRVFSMGLGMATLAGGALHLFLHGTGGALWSLLAGRINSFWIHLAASLAAAFAWYGFLMYAFWPVAAPVVSRLSPMPTTFLAYLLFAAALSRNAHRARELQSAWNAAGDNGF